MMVTLEEKFYVGESGFYFTVQTGLSMAGANAGDIRSVLKRPNGSIVRRTIPLTDILNGDTGETIMLVGSGDLNAPGIYRAQIWVRDTSLNRMRPSHEFRFEVLDTISNGSGIFA